MKDRSMRPRPSWTGFRIVHLFGILSILCAMPGSSLGIETARAAQDDVLAAIKRHYRWPDWADSVKKPGLIEETPFNEKDFAAFGNQVKMKWAQPHSRSIYILNDSGKVETAIAVNFLDSPDAAHAAVLRQTIMLPRMAYFLAEAPRFPEIGDVCFFGKRGKPLASENMGDHVIQSLIFARNNVSVSIFAPPYYLVPIASAIDSKLLESLGPAQPFSAAADIESILTARYGWKNWAGKEAYPGKIVRRLQFDETDFRRFGSDIMIHSVPDNTECPVYVLNDAGKTVSCIYIVALDSPAQAQYNMLLATLGDPTLDYGLANGGDSFDIGDACVYGVSKGVSTVDAAATQRRKVTHVIFTRSNCQARIWCDPEGPDPLEIARMIDARLISALEIARPSEAKPSYTGRQERLQYVE